MKSEVRMWHSIAGRYLPHLTFMNGTSCITHSHTVGIILAYWMRQDIREVAWDSLHSKRSNTEPEVCTLITLHAARKS